MTLDKQSEDELQVFGEFIEYCPLEIHADSIIKQDPPRPDIRCSTVAGRELEFELVELVDRDMAKAASDTGSLQMFIENEAEKCLKSSAQYRDSYVVFDIDRSTSTVQRRNALRTVLERLCDADHVEKVVRQVAQDFSQVIRRLKVIPGFPEGPHFQVTLAGSIGDPTMRGLEGKISKNYEVEGELNLLAYFGQQPMLLGTAWWPDYDGQIRSMFEGSAFLAVWVFDRNSGKVVEVRILRR